MIKLTYTIERITGQLSILDLISKYTTLKVRGKNFTGQCPFCKSNTGLIVSPHKNIFKCFSCFAGGNPIKFVMLFKKLDFKEAVYFLVLNFGKTLGFTDEVSKGIRRTLGTVFVLGLQEDCYFIGFSTDPERSIKDHFDGKDLLWTRVHRPLKVLRTFPDKSIRFADGLMERAIEKYGGDRVRGGDLVYFGDGIGFN